MKTAVDLNCDMSENFGQWIIGDASDAQLMPLISSANVAAGFHAGDPNLMNRATQLCYEHGVGFGVHPGYKDLQGFGRRYIQASNDELINDITYQIGALREFGRKYGISLQHVKLHGALYMEAAKNKELSQTLINLLKKTLPEKLIFCMAGSETEKAANNAGYKPIREFYADRDYDDSGSIVFTRKVRALYPDAVADKCLKACMEGVVETVQGNTIEIPFESICFHSDTPGALEIGTAIRDKLVQNGIKIVPAASLI